MSAIYYLHTTIQCIMKGEFVYSRVFDCVCHENRLVKTSTRRFHRLQITLEIGGFDKASRLIFMPFVSWLLDFLVLKPIIWTKHVFKFTIHYRLERCVKTQVLYFLIWETKTIEKRNLYIHNALLRKPSFWFVKLHIIFILSKSLQVFFVII